MSDNHRPSYVALVAALRAEFTPMQLEALIIRIEVLRYAPGSAGVLRQAVSDAWDVAYDATSTRTEYAWVPDGDPPLLVPCPEELARRRSKQLGGSGFVREVTEWRAES